MHRTMTTSGRCVIKEKKEKKKVWAFLSCLPTVTAARPSSGDKFYEQSRGGCTDFTLLSPFSSAAVFLYACCGVHGSWLLYTCCSTLEHVHNRGETWQCGVSSSAKYVVRWLTTKQQKEVALCVTDVPVFRFLRLFFFLCWSLIVFIGLLPKFVSRWDLPAWSYWKHHLISKQQE